MNVMDSVLKIWALNGWKQHPLSEIQVREGEHAKQGESTYAAF